MRLPLILAAAVLVPGALGAQAAPGPERRFGWTMTGLRAGFCVHFLVDPRETRETPLADRPWRILADSPDAPPSLREVLAHQPEYGDWIPASLCLYAFDTVQANGRIFTDRRRPKSVLVWKVASRPDGPGEEAHWWSAISVTDGGIAHQSNQPAADFDRFSLDIGPVPQGTDTIPKTDVRYRIRVDGAELRWDGHLSADSLPAGPAVSDTLALRGSQDSRWLATWELPITRRQYMVGSLAVEGKSGLARALRASPTRYIGPMFFGPGGAAVFFR